MRKKIIWLAVLAITAITFSSCNSPMYSIQHGFTQCGNEIEMTENNTINENYVSLGWVYIQANSGEIKVEKEGQSTKYKNEKKRVVETNEIYTIEEFDLYKHNQFKNNKKWKQASYNDLTEYANMLVKEMGGDAIINVAFEPIYEYDKTTNTTYIKFLTMRGEVVKKRNNN